MVFQGQVVAAQAVDQVWRQSAVRGLWAKVIKAAMSQIPQTHLEAAAAAVARLGATVLRLLSAQEDMVMSLQ